MILINLYIYNKNINKIIINNNYDNNNSNNNVYLPAELVKIRWPISVKIKIN